MSISWNILSKYKLELYGFSILWIMLFHGLEMKNTAIDRGLSIFSSFILHGNCGVEIFLFLSGIYLFFSMKKDNDIGRFYIKRGIRLFFPFIFMDGTYWGYFCIIQNQDLFEFIKNMTFYSFWSGEGVQTVWFIALMIPLYLLYPLIYNKINKFYCIFYIIILIYLCCYLLSCYFYSYYKSVEIALTRIPVFLLGCYCGKLTFNKMMFKGYILILTFICVIWGLYYFYFYPFNLVKCFRIPYLFIGPSLTIWLCIVFEFLKNLYIAKFLSFFGKISLELYLSHIIMRRLTRGFNIYDSNDLISNYHRYLFMVVMSSVCISVIVNRLYTYITKRIE